MTQSVSEVLLSPTKTREEMVRICEHCGNIVEPFEGEIFGQKRFLPVACPCEIKRYEDAIREQEQRDKIRRIEKLFGQSQLGPKFKESTFKTWEQLPGTQAILKEAVEFVKEFRWKKGEGLLFYGNPGNGKSHLAATVVNAVIPMGVAAVFQIVPDLIAKINKAAQNFNSDDNRVIDLLCEADLVVLDDLGAERLNERNQETIYRIINSIYINKKSLIITTNSDVESELEDRIGSRIYDRVIEMCRIVKNKGFSYRRKIAVERMKVE